ncbi:NADPH-dependent ferric siderophore reductase, contains FAD-binding and SIP domains [Methylobacterium sp. ap11]|uniref:siderophore-interacting protein n=1 Tax=Methylobacterium sp. ap11 TaxID=1761799 RepID=UPI0008AB1ED6|nr:siderophore-interacting protein [Methylobacterium sp. ap11]SEP41646.1 NADPH-dependent ferric siderophore reductase, contains FAD-binding and SIP domains [Methylobacterium sp. ap11]
MQVRVSAPARSAESGPRPEAPRLLRVLATRAVTPRLRRITLACDEAALFAGTALHARLLVPCPFGPLRGADGAAAAARYYTVRSVRPDGGEIDVDVVLHAPSGPGSRWAGETRPGDRVAVVGPIGRPVPATGPLVLVGDETALPVIGRLIEEAAPGRRIDAVVEVADRGEEQAVACRPGVRLAFLHRRPGRRGQLARAAADLAREAGEGHVLYAGVEAGTARALAALVRGCPDLAVAQHRIVTYWRRQDDDATAR